MKVSEAIKRLRAILDERGDLPLVIRIGDEWPPYEEDIKEIRIQPPYDEHERYDDRNRAVIFLGGLT